jgi:group I intron endonuclease
MYSLFDNYQNFPRESGIYKILTTNNKCFYIGSSLSLRKRMKDHRNLLKNDKHNSSYMQNVYNTHGKNVFKVEFLLYYNSIFKLNSIEHKRLLKTEEHFISKLKPRYNTIQTPTTQINNPSTAKKVYQYDKKGLFIKEWCSIREVNRILNIQIQNGLRKSKNSRSSGGYQWSFEKVDKLPIYKSNCGVKSKQIISIYDLWGNLQNTFNSIKEGLVYLNHIAPITRNELTNLIKNSKGWNNQYRFAYGNAQILDNSINAKHIRGYIILQYDLNGKFIKIWGNTELAHHALGLTSIYDNISNKTKQCGNFIWKKL